MGSEPLASYCRYFCMVRQLGSVRAASEALDVEPSADSKVLLNASRSLAAVARNFSKSAVA
jgi:DNA-binding transcriptional LysR family regulator